MDITQLLAFGVEQGASDCHLSAGEPPMLRVHGDLKKLDGAALSAEEVHALIVDIMNDAQRKTFQETLECDFSFALGETARFRVVSDDIKHGLAIADLHVDTMPLPVDGAVRIDLQVERPKPTSGETTGPAPEATTGTGEQPS